MPSYMFLFSTDNRQFIKFDVADPPLQFAFEISGIPVKASLYLYGSPSFQVLAEYEGTGMDVANLADALIHTMYGVYDSAGLAMGIAHTLRLEGICEVGKKFHGGFTYALPKFEG